MNKSIIQTADAPAAIGTYSQAVRVDDTVYLSGQIGLDPASMQMVDGIEAQIHQVFKNLAAVAAAAGGSLADVVKLNVFLTDLGHFPKVNEIMAGYFSQPYPARAAVGVAALPRGALVEADAVMVLGIEIAKLKAASPFSFPVSPALAAKLAKLGLDRDADLVLHLPLRWEDETRLTPIRDLLPGQTAQVQAVVREASVAYRPRRMLTVTVEDASGGVLGIRFLNFYPSHLKLFQPGESFRFNGEVRGGFLGLEMVHPRFVKADDATPLPTQLTPVYPTTAGLGQATLRKLIERALAAPISDTLPADWLAELGLPELEASIRLLHQPPLDCALAELESRRHPAWQRLAFDELLAQQLSLATARQQRKSRPTLPLPPREQLTTAFTRTLPFALTGAQARAWQEISADLAQPHPMRRLLQGDVGSGKTVVAALACLQAIENGFQAAFMAPTEILAEQHYRKLAPPLVPLGVRCAWVSGSQRKAERAAAWQAIAAGEADLAFGTHALFQEAGSFQRLGLAMVDEQHRFGVGQRLALMQKGSEPHQLMMSATPIPRTLAMSYFADLDVSVIDELPPGRTPIVTKLVSAARRDDVLARVTRRLPCRRPGLLGVPADRGIGEAAAADRAGHLCDAGGTAA